MKKTLIIIAVILGLGSLAYFKKTGEGLDGRTVELERTLGVGNGSRMDPALFPTPRVRPSGRSREVARVQVFPKGSKNAVPDCVRALGGKAAFDAVFDTSFFLSF